jgi:hypothetical protein
VLCQFDHWVHEGHSLADFLVLIVIVVSFALGVFDGFFSGQPILHNHLQWLFPSHMSTVTSSPSPLHDSITDQVGIHGVIIGASQEVLQQNLIGEVFVHTGKTEEVGGREELLLTAVTHSALVHEHHLEVVELLGGLILEVLLVVGDVVHVVPNPLLRSCGVQSIVLRWEEYAILLKKLLGLTDFLHHLLRNFPFGCQIDSSSDTDSHNVGELPRVEVA